MSHPNANAPATGLYDPAGAKESCGFGVIAHRRGEASLELTHMALESLRCMAHRGAVAADGVTGDGCGVLLQRPEAFLRNCAEQEFGRALSAPSAVASLFLSSTPYTEMRQRIVISHVAKEHGMQVLGWRKVPTDASACGALARSTMPEIVQLFVEAPDMDLASFRRACFATRRSIERALRIDGEFYVCGFSPDTLSYKALVMPDVLSRFYPDLRASDMACGICSFHQRFSTNTLPAWGRVQPFRMLAHNGEINAILGNLNWASSREALLASPLLPPVAELTPLIDREGSDSAALDNMLDLLVAGGMDIIEALRMLIPPAWQNRPDMPEALRAFYQHCALRMEPWDGPAGIVVNDGRHAICMLDRNGLRPARYVVTRNGFVTVASESGTWPYAPADVLEKGRVGPGQMLVVDTATGQLLGDAEIGERLGARAPYARWIDRGLVRLADEDDAAWTADEIPDADWLAWQKLFLLTLEEREQVLRPMAENGQEAVGAMGDDMPLPALSSHIRPLYDSFRQRFAQVTNPPIDSLRESLVMSLSTYLGPSAPVFADRPPEGRRIEIETPVLSPARWRTLVDGQAHLPVARLDCSYRHADADLPSTLERLAAEAVEAVERGAVLLALSDQHVAPDRLAVHSLLATGAVHHALIAAGLRCRANILVMSASARDAHQVACLIGFGASGVYPYLGYRAVRDGSASPVDAMRRYRAALNKGLLKILSKMGISAVSSYRGAQLFDAFGIGPAVMARCFKGLGSPLGGMDFADLESDAMALKRLAWNRRKSLPPGGLLKYMHGGEYHAFNPDVVEALRCAVETGDRADYQRYAELVNGREVAALRDLLALRVAETPLALEEVEPVEAIARRFDSAGMSLGALSPEAHETLAVAMHRLGGRSNSGEGGEDAARFGTERSSRIKQVASARFGVSAHYLRDAEVLQIKIAQGAKPGEGGQLPGGKVTGLIARLRCAMPGVTLISPPPHHDIYSIEDLAQLIFDLKQVNPHALVSVKLVAGAGVGTIAVGVAKAYADCITISGYDGGTAASPLSSIRYAGLPWEMGLAETHQALRGNGLRGAVRLQADGGMKTGLDVVKAALLGAESFGFGTAPMVAMGCKYLRICHLNNCATGVATQDDALRQRYFIGNAQRVMRFFRFVAAEVREHLAALGAPSLESVIGRVERLEAIDGPTERLRRLDLSALLASDVAIANQPMSCRQPSNVPGDRGVLAERMVADMRVAIATRAGGRFDYAVRNFNRAIGARVSGEIAARHGNHGMADAPLEVRLNGVAGQSFGAWNVDGLNMSLAGDANDYVGKGMAGGRLALCPPPESVFDSRAGVIMGNTCLYGATGGELYAAGRAGERFAVRNSGAHAVVEGAGDHCCEYMTGGAVAVTGPVGANLGAGMTGGVAFVLDADGALARCVNPELVEWRRLGEGVEAFGYDELLADMLAAQARYAPSEWSRSLSAEFARHRGRFCMVTAKGADLPALLEAERARRAGAGRRSALLVSDAVPA